MRSEIQNWLSEVFGMDVILRPTTLGGAVGGGCYDYWTVSGLLADFVLVTPKPGVRNPSVLEAARLVYEVRNLTYRWSAYGCLSLSAVERKRLRLSRPCGTALVRAGCADGARPCECSECAGGAPPCRTEASVIFRPREPAGRRVRMILLNPHCVL